MKSYRYPSFGKIEYMYDNYVHVAHLSKAADEDRKILATGGCSHLQLPKEKVLQNTFLASSRAE